jgi:hypothetical protein
VPSAVIVYRPERLVAREENREDGDDYSRRGEKASGRWGTVSVVFVADDLGSWLVGLLADAARKKLTALLLGDEQSRALRQAATAAVQTTAVEASPSDDEQAEQLAMVISEVFRAPITDVSLGGHVTLLEGLQEGIAAQLAVLDDASLTGTGQSSADVLGVPGAVLADRLTGHLVREIMFRGSHGGPLKPLADQINHELTRLQGQRVEGMLARLADLHRPVRPSAAAGTVHVSGDINPVIGAPVRTRYRQQVLRIVPPFLVGRDTELAELAEFCTAPEPRRPYTWWRGDAWAGKSALMSWFVLHPPQGIRLVSFFITAQLASQDNRVAFIENVLEQLAVLLGEPVPAPLTESIRDAHLLDMLSNAAHACESRGERLVLVVDGLDEDRGVTTDPFASYSIAALLPDPPPADMKIIVAGRRSPRIPGDVPEDHWLRDPAIVRRLVPSPYAAVVRNGMERELRRLLRGSEAEQGLLSMLTAARGGLSISDLAELTERPTWQVEDELGTVAGRSFSPRPSSWLPGIRADVFVLGHGDLQDTAENYLGTARLGASRQRLHGWADKYRARSWPDDTPEYLLQDYYGLLIETGDLWRMTGCATDPRRHDWMLDVTGGQAAALAEITTAQDAILAQPESDLLIMARLAIHRDSLAARNNNIPTRLPAVLASLGRLTRAETLAQSITDADRQADALAELANAMADIDIARASKLALSISNRDRQADALASVAKKVTAGDLSWADELARSICSISYADPRTAALADLVAAVAGFHPDRAEALALSVTNPAVRAAAVAALLKAIVDTDPDRARTVAQRVDTETLARSITDPGELPVLADLGRTLAGIDADRARTLCDRAETLARKIADPEDQAAVLAGLAEWVAVVDPNRAEALAQSITSPVYRALALVRLAEALAGTDPDQARALVWKADALVCTIADPDLERLQAAGFGFADLVVLAGLADATDADGTRARFDRAETLLRAIKDPGNPASSRPDAPPWNIYQLLLDRLEALARQSTDPDLQEAALTVLTEALPRIAEAIAAAEPGRARAVFDRLEAVVRARIDHGHSPEAAATSTWLVPIAVRIAEASAPADPDQARSLLDQAVASLEEAENVTCRLLDQGDEPEGLDELVGSLVEALTAAVRVMARTDPDQACALADHAEGAVFAIIDALANQVRDADERVGLARFRARALVALAEAMAVTDPARAGTLADRAEATARAITDNGQLERAATWLPLLALEVARVDRDRAHLLFDRVETLVRALTDSDDMFQPAFPRAMRELLEAAAADPDLIHPIFDRVISLTFESEDPDRDWHAVLAAAVKGLDPERACTLFDRAEAMARAFSGAGPQAGGLAYLAKLVGCVDPARAGGLFKEAQTLACSITDPADQADALAELGERVSGIDRAWANGLFDQAQTLAYSITDPGKQADALAGLAEKAAAVDPDRTCALFDRVEALLQAINDSHDFVVQQSVAAHLVQAMARLDATWAAYLAAQAERLIRAINEGRLWMWTQAGTMGDLAEAIAGVDLNRAEALARSIADPQRQAQALASMAIRAARLNPDRAQALTSSITDPEQREQAFRGLEDAEMARQAKAVADADLGQAEALAQKINNPEWQALVLTNLARQAAPAHARRLIARAFRLGFWAMPLDVLAQVEPTTLTMIADELLQNGTLFGSAYAQL